MEDVEFLPVTQCERGIMETFRTSTCPQCSMCSREILDDQRGRQCPTCELWVHASCWCRHECPDDIVSDRVSPPQGIFTNMADFLQAIRYETKRETRRHDANFTELEQPTTRSMFSGLMCALYQTGHAESKNPLQENLAPTPQDQRLAQLCRKWLTEDLLAENDLANHYLLSQNYPVASTRRRRMPGDEPEEPIARRARHTCLLYTSDAADE